MLRKTACFSNFSQYTMEVWGKTLHKNLLNIKAMVPAFVVVPVPAVVGAVAFVPNVCQGLHGLGLLLVQPVEEVPVDRPAVAPKAALVNPHGGDQQAFVACHDVGEVPQGLRRVASLADVDVYSAHVAGVALRSGVAEAAEELLQGFDVFVGQDGRYQFGLLVAVFCIDADVPLKFPFPALLVPCAPSVVAVAVCRVLVAPGSEEVGGNLGGLLAADAVHLDLHPDGLLLHGLNLLCGACLHFENPLSAFRLAVFFLTVYITLMRDIIK